MARNNSTRDSPYVRSIMHRNVCMCLQAPEWRNAVPCILLQQATCKIIEHVNLCMAVWYGSTPETYGVARRSKVYGMAGSLHSSHTIRWSQCHVVP